MFKLISFKANGERIENVMERPDFYALECNGVIIQYYSTLEAFHAALEEYRNADDTQLEIEIAA